MVDVIVVVLVRVKELVVVEDTVTPGRFFVSRKIAMHVR